MNFLLTRYVGVGAMVVGGISSIYKVRHGLVSAVKELKKKPDGQHEEEHDIPAWAINLFSSIAILLVGIVYYHLTKNVGIAVLTSVIMIVMSFFFTAVASYIVGLVGNSNSPVSGMTITAVLFTAVLLLVFGFSGTEGMIATMGVAAIVCCAACTYGDVCNDLKTGHLVGATPFKQQIMQIAGVAVAALVMAPVLQLLHENVPGGIGGKELAAPQAALFASLAEGFFGQGELKWSFFIWGATLGVVILIIDKILASKNSSFRAHLMPIAVGMYLPFGLAIPILAGGILCHLIIKGKNDVDAEKAQRRGVLFASGAIAGESLMGVGLALLASMGINSLNLGISKLVVEIVTIIVAILLVVFFRRASLTKE